MRLSLEPVFRRQWASTCDALSDGSIDPAAFQRLVAPYLAELTPVEGRQLWAIDGSSWPRPDAVTSPERTCCRVPIPGSAGQSIIDGWEWQWLVGIPEAAGSWVLPLSVERRSRAAGTPTQLAITQVRQMQEARAATGAEQVRPLLLLDSQYDVVQLVEADLGVDLLCRLARNRVFSRRPVWSGVGRKPLHGPTFKLADPTTHGEPDHHLVQPDATHGTLTIDVWDHLHRPEAAHIEVALIRIQLGHYAPRAHRTGSPKALWLVWHGAGVPPDLVCFRAWYQRRFAIEHAFRFLKQELGWTKIRPRAPQTAERWSWLLGLAWWQLWLARGQITAPRLPWERPPPPGQPCSPGQVRRALAACLRALGTPARPPKVRGMSPGRQRGVCPGRAPRHPAQKRGPPQRRKRRNTPS
ncbi:MAG: hypothetical protein KC442_11150 [Thermomicrobiales bacterium]|nr:hypothetical protein [Thermomicrobiales bacterium]